MEGRQVLYLCYWRRFFNLWTGVWDSRCRVDWAAPVYCALPPYPPPPLPSSPPLPPPLATCGDLAGRQQLRGRPAEHCWQLPSGSAACEQYYSNTSAGIALCMAPAEREAAVCGQSGFILDCTSPPPSPPPGRPISALEAAIGIDTALASAHQRRIFAASALAAFLVLLFMAVSCAFFVSQTAAAAPPPPDVEAEEADAAAAGGEGKGSYLLAGAVRSDEATNARGSWNELAHTAMSELAHDAQEAASATYSTLSDLARHVKEKRLSLSGGQLPGPTAAAAATAAEYGGSEAARVAARATARMSGSFEDAEQ